MAFNLVDVVRRRLRWALFLLRFRAGRAVQGGGELTRTSRGWEREELVSSKATSVGLNFGTW